MWFVCPCHASDHAVAFTLSRERKSSPSVVHNSLAVHVYGKNEKEKGKESFRESYFLTFSGHSSGGFSTYSLRGRQESSGFDLGRHLSVERSTSRTRLVLQTFSVVSSF